MKLFQLLVAYSIDKIIPESYNEKALSGLIFVSRHKSGYLPGIHLPSGIFTVCINYVLYHLLSLTGLTGRPFNKIKSFDG